MRLRRRFESFANGAVVQFEFPPGLQIGARLRAWQSLRAYFQRVFSWPNPWKIMRIRYQMGRYTKSLFCAKLLRSTEGSRSVG